MSDARSSAESIPLPDYEVEQYFPRNSELGEEQYRQLRQNYGFVRAWFKTRPESYRDLQRWLNQSRMGTTYDVYLTRTVWLAAIAALGGVSLGLVVSVWLVSAGVFAGIELGVASTSPLAPFVTALAAYKALIGTVAVTLVLGIGVGGSVALVRYYQPRTRAELRARAIDVVLPHAIVYLYALSHGGMNFIEAIRSLAEESDYGEVANEFDMIVRDMDLFGNDLFTALRNTRNLTPSSNFEQFVDDLLSILDSGGDVTKFLDGESKTYIQESMEEQEDFLETLSMLSEIFIAAFVAAPLLLIVTLIVISFMGGDTLAQLYVLNYLVFPLGMALFLLLIDMLGRPFSQEVQNPTVESSAPSEVRVVLVDATNAARRALAEFVEARWNERGTARHPAATDGGTEVGVGSPQFEAYRRHNAFGAFVHLLSDPITLIRRQPQLTLVVTVPLALGALAAVVTTGVVAPSVEALFENPVGTTFWLALLPLSIVAIPLSVFHEMERARELTVERRFPDTLNVLSSANQMGIPLVDSLALVARWSSGVLAEELGKLHNDVVWNGDTVTALNAFATRLSVPRLSRVIRLIAKGGQSSGDLSRILSVAAEDTRNRYKLERSRRRAMSTYIAIVVIGFLVYLFVIVMLSTAYLGPLEQLQTPETSGPTGGLPMNMGAVPIDAYRVVFFHSAVVQAIGSGMLAGKLADNSTISGLKYSIGLTAIAVIAFVLI